MAYKPKSLDDINSQYDSEVSATKAIERGRSKVATEAPSVPVTFDVPTEAPSFEQTPVDSTVPDISGAVNNFIRSMNAPVQNQKPSRINTPSRPVSNQPARKPGYRPAGPAAPRTGVQGLENQRFGTQQRPQNSQYPQGERRFMNGATPAPTAGGGPNYAQQKAAAQEARRQAAEQAARKRVQDNKRAISSGNKRADGANIDDLFSEYESIMGDQAAPDRASRRERRHGKDRENTAEPVVQQSDEPVSIPPSRVAGFDQFFNEVAGEIPEEERKKSAPKVKQSNFDGVFDGTDYETLPYSTKQFLYEQKARYAEQARQVQEEYDRRRAEDYVRNETESEILRAEQHRIRIEQEERERRAEEDRIARELEAKQREEMLARQHQEELARREAEIEQLRQEKERLLAQQEAAREAEQLRLQEEARKAEELRLAEEARAVEEAKRQEELRAAEEARQEEEARRLEDARIYEEHRLAEEARHREELRQYEQQRQSEEARRQEEARIREQQRQAEEARRQEETRLFEQQRQAQQEELIRRAREEAAREAARMEREKIAREMAEQSALVNEAERLQAGEPETDPENTPEEVQPETVEELHLSRSEKKRRAKEAKRAAKRAAQMAAYVSEPEAVSDEEEPAQSEDVQDVQPEYIAEESQPEQDEAIAEEAFEEEPQLSRAELKRRAKEEKKAAKRAAKLARKNRKSDDDFDDFVEYFGDENQEAPQDEEPASVEEQPVITPAPAELDVEDIFAENEAPAEEPAEQPVAEQPVITPAPAELDVEDIFAENEAPAEDTSESIEENQPDESNEAVSEDDGSENVAEDTVSDDSDEAEGDEAEEAKPKKKSHGFIRGFFRFILSIVMIVVILFAGVTALFENVVHLNSGKEITVLSDFYAYTCAQNPATGDVKYGDIVICRDLSSPEKGQTFVYRTDEGYSFGTRDSSTAASVDTITLDDGTTVDKGSYIGTAFVEIPYIGYAYLTIASVADVSMNVIAIAAAVLALVLFIIVVFALKNRSDRKEEKRFAKAQAKAAKAMERDRAKGRIVDDGVVAPSNANTDEEEYDEYYDEPIDRESFEFEDISSSNDDAEETAEAPAPEDMSGQPVVADISRPLEVPEFEESTDESAAEEDPFAEQGNPDKDPFADVSSSENVDFSDDPFADIPQDGAETPAEDITTDEAFEELFINDPIPASTKKSRKQKKKEKRAKKAAAAAPAPEADDDDDFDDIFDSL